MDIKQRPNSLSFIIDAGPLVLFFLTNFFAPKFGVPEDKRFMLATGVLIVAVLVALIYSYIVTKKLAVMPLVTAIPVIIFGGLTIYFNDESFLKMKPTIINLLIAATLMVGLFFKTYLLTYLFGKAFELTDAGWRGLTIRYALFCVLLAVLNEYVWRTMSTDAWVNFKVWAILPLGIGFMLMQMPFITKHSVSK
jgi:intracellular septation protein